MNSLYKDYLFSKHYFVNDKEKSGENFETLFSLAHFFEIKITNGQDLAEPSMVKFAAKHLGVDVPEPFYRGFPQSVRALSSDQLLYDQLVHYTVTYGFGDFSQAGHSLFEENLERLAFHEGAEVKEFSILSESEALEKLFSYMEDLLQGTRPLSKTQYELVKNLVLDYDYSLEKCASKDTIIRLMVDTKKTEYSKFLHLSDVISMVDYLNVSVYENPESKKLNLKNQDRKFITGVLNHFFYTENCNVRECYEKKALWNGLLHHIHYRTVNETAEKFVQCMRTKGNESVFSQFEKCMEEHRIMDAVTCLREGKGTGALLRNLNYLLSRCENAQEVEQVLSQIHTQNPIILIQLILQYGGNAVMTGRTFRFTKNEKLRIHYETEEEISHRKSFVPENISKLVTMQLRKNLEEIYHNRLGRVYIAPEMKNMALPIQETTSMGGFGVLAKGSRLSIPEGKKIRVFTYWEKVDDIDLSIIGLDTMGNQTEFSWRRMAVKQSEALTFSGDETSGFHGGSEYFDVDIEKFQKLYPDIRYLIVCDNVFSGSKFTQCFCKAGYMMRDCFDSGKVYEPKTVKSSFLVNCDSQFAYLFGLDLMNREFVWLNTARDSNANIAGATSMGFLQDYFHWTSILNLYDLFTMLASNVVEKPEDADVIVSDLENNCVDGKTVIHSYDFEKIMAYMNGNS